MVKQILSKTIALFLVMVMTMGNVSLIGTNVYAAFEELEQQKTESSDKNVSFDTYFQVGNNRVHGVTLDAKQEAYVNFEVKVGNGFLKDSTISLNNANFEIESIEAQSIDGIVKKSTANTIELNQINSNKTVTISAKIKMGHPEYVETNYCQRETTATFVSNYTNIKGKENTINAQINVGISWIENEFQTSIDSNVQKYMQFGNKAVIETKITSKLNENVLPIKNTNIKVIVPKVGENLPEEVRVHAISTKATNGITNGESFNADNWNYNSESGELTINVENTANQEGKVAWKNGTDEYIVTYIYETTETIPAIEIKAQNTITTYTEATAENSIEKTEAITLNGNYVDYGITGTEKVSKGYIYANSVYETNYNEKITANISYKDATEGLVFTKDVEAYNTDNGKIAADTYYKNTIISKSNFEKILGQEGQIKIFNGETLLGTIDKNTQPDENGNLVYNYTANYNTIRIETTKPVEEGIINIENNKAIAATSSYNYETQKIIRNIETTLIGTSANQEAQTQTAITNLEETTTKAHVEIGTPNLSTVVTNENVEIRAILEADDITDDLYKNPTVRIELPEEVENINVKSANVLFGDGFQISSIGIESNRILHIALAGEQTQYITDNNKGITVIINADINVRKTATSAEKQVTMNITNEKAISLENEGVSSTPLNIVAPKGVITLNSAKNTLTGEAGTSSGENKKEIKLERKAQKQTAQYTNTVINNNGGTISNLKILGTIPSKGDKYGSTIDTKFASNVESVEGLDISVYYSENINVKADLNNTENGWREEITEDSKAYLVVVNSKVQQGQELNFTYSVELGENLEYGVKAISSYKVEYAERTEAENQLASLENINIAKYAVAEAEQNQTTPTETVEATPVTLSTGEGAVLEASLSNNADTETNANQVITYELRVKNTGTADAEDVKAKMVLPEGASVVEKYWDTDGRDDTKDPEFIYSSIGGISYKKINSPLELGNIKCNETKILEILVISEKENTEISAYAEILMGEETKTNSNTITNKIIEKGNFDIEINGPKEGSVGDELQYCILINNNTIEKIKNVEESIKIPDELEYVNSYIYNVQEGNDDEDIDDDIIDDSDSDDEWLNKTTDGIEYNEKTKTLKVSAGDLEKQDVVEKELYITVRPVKEGETVLQLNISGNGMKTQKSTLKKIKIYPTKVDVDISATTDSGYINDQIDGITYTIKLKNNGEKITNIEANVQLPEELKYFSKSASNTDTTFSSKDNNLKINTIIEPNEEVEIQFSVVSNFEENTEDKDIKVKIDINRLNYSKEFNYKIEGNKDVNPDNPDDNKGTYKISGIAWLDANKDATITEGETKVANIPVKALDKDGNVKATATTAEDGTYTLQGLAKGTYTVIFEYDSSKYMLTEYQKEGTEESKNSKVVDGSYNGKKVATTNNITIDNTSIANINIGLIEGSNFDLSLNKKVTQISMANTKTTKTKKYDTQLAKIDLDYKYINSTKIAVEYEITVTNEGDIPGYASKIVDYLPEGFDFSSELNKDWYTSGNGIETNALEKELINPGESKTVTLVLTKNMTENGNGIYSNTAEIAEAYNDYAKEDSDSTPGNNKEGEDDQSSANVILGLKTGGPITYITLTITIMALVSIAAYEINKRVLKI